MPSSFTVAFVPGVTPGKWARVWHERLGNVRLELVATEQESALEMLRSGAADVALVRLPIDRDVDGDRPLAAIALYTERAVVVVPKDHSFATSDSVVIAELSKENQLPGDWRAATELVAANVGVAVMPQSVARSLMRRDLTAKLVEDGPEWHVAVAWRDASVDPHVEEFIGIVRGRTARSSRGTASSSETTGNADEANQATVSVHKQARRNRAQPRGKHPQGKFRRPPRPGKR
jgi:DNA-binding transcriptional LysR family regulator